MRKTRNRSLNRLSLVVCAATLAASAGPAQACEEAEALVSIERYCSVSWRNAGILSQQWADCTQQAMTCLLERISRNRLGIAIRDKESPERRELNRSIWCTIQRHRRAPKHVSMEDHDLSQHRDTRSTNPHADQWESVQTAAADCLTDRQQKIIQRTRDGWSIREIADDLAITPARASDEKYKAIRKLKERLA